MTTIEALKTYYTYGSGCVQDLVEPEPHFIDMTPRVEVEDELYEDGEGENKKFYVDVCQIVEVQRRVTYVVYAESEDSIRDMIHSGLFDDLCPTIVAEELYDDVLDVVDDGLNRPVEIDEAY